MPITLVTTVALSQKNYIDALLSTDKWGGGVGTSATLTYSLPYIDSATPTWATNYSDKNEPGNYSTSAISTLARTAFVQALAQWSEVANLTFTHTSESTPGVIRVAAIDDPTSSDLWGWAYFPEQIAPAGGDIWINQPSDSEGWAGGSANFSSLLHELGHVLGLKHPFDNSPNLPSSEDSGQYSLMSYTDHPHATFRVVTDNGGGHYSFTYNAIQPETPMLYDIAAIQYLYGANTSTNSGDTTYTLDPAVPFFKTIWDGGGTDTISAANFSKGCTIDLTAGHFSKITIESDPLPAGYTGGTVATYDGTDNLAIAYGVTIEKASGGSGNDSILGNTANNTLTGGAGNDTLSGGDGTDQITYLTTRNNCSIQKTATGFTVNAENSGEGVDSLATCEKIQFTDFSINLSIGDDSKTMTTADLHSLEELYVAFFNRVPDADGLDYWLTQFKNGQTFSQIANNFYTVAIQYSNLTGYSATMTNEDFIKIIYENVLGRTGVTPGEISGWADGLNNGQATRGGQIANMLSAAHSYKGDPTWGWVPDLLDNKITVADFFAVRNGLNYASPEESISKGMEIAAAVTATDTTQALSLIGVTDAGFSLV